MGGGCDFSGHWPPDESLSRSLRPGYDTGPLIRVPTRLFHERFGGCMFM